MLRTSDRKHSKNVEISSSKKSSSFDSRSSVGDARIDGDGGCGSGPTGGSDQVGDVDAAAAAIALCIYKGNAGDSEREPTCRRMSDDIEARLITEFRTSCFISEWFSGISPDRTPLLSERQNSL